MRAPDVATQIQLTSQRTKHDGRFRLALKKYRCPRRLAPCYRKSIETRWSAQPNIHTVTSATTQHQTPSEFVELTLWVTTLASAFRKLSFGNNYPLTHQSRKCHMKQSILAIALLSTLAMSAQAAPNDGVVGPYARVEVGRTNFNLSSSLPQVGNDETGNAAKFFGGYRFTENFGAEVGYAALGSFSESVRIGGVNVNQDGKARSVFAVATGRLPLHESFALHSRLGLSSGKVSGTNALPNNDSLMGSATSLMLGVGAEYKPTSNVAMTVNYDSYGKLSNNVKANSVVLGLHFWF